MPPLHSESLPPPHEGHRFLEGSHVASACPQGLSLGLPVHVVSPSAGSSRVRRCCLSRVDTPRPRLDGCKDKDAPAGSVTQPPAAWLPTRMPAEPYSSPYN